MNGMRKVVAGILALLLGWTGMLGSSGVVVLCLHANSAAHLVDHPHQNQCGDIPYEEFAEDEALLSLSGVRADCFDFELKGVDDQCILPADKIPFTGPALAVSQTTFDDLPSFSFEVTKRILPFLRAPPYVDMVTEQCIKKTVLRI